MLIRFREEDFDGGTWQCLKDKSGIANEDKLSRFCRIAGRYENIARRCLNPRASVIEINDFNIRNGRLFACGTDCGEIKISDKDASKIRMVYAYALCAGEFETDIDPVADSFIDLWGNAYCDVLHNLLRERLRIESGGLMISPPFGPGFFHTGAEKLPEIARISKADSIGVTMSETYMIPLKSCVGFFLGSEEPVDIPEQDCGSCIGNCRNCNYCRWKS